ncbi:MAG: trypsin-like peptidase domain-containing protein [Planctomycetes bacterium]|nr:trypsin-like peptidase domain-containing protein [Planctomycetota bacterium]MBI3844550.1 trypsin-like peptidase domain-containing protein [Planctomycetota bacterium]
MTRAARHFGIFALALLAVLVGMSVRVSFDWVRLFGSARPDPQMAAMRAEIASAVDPYDVFRKVAKVVGPSVVSIHGDVRGDMYSGEQAGTGVIVDTEGHVLTNFHVIANTEKLSVELANGKHYRASVAGGDSVVDLAVLQIEDVSTEVLQSVVFGDSDAIEVGQSVLAIGNAFELRGTVTHGIISAKARPVMTKALVSREGAIPVLDDFIQTDAPINPGNSGGPLVDIHGDVIGINTLIYSRSGTSAGIGFAIPSNYAKQVLRQILENGHIVRGGIGIQVPPEEAMTTDALDGVHVDAVSPRSPADDAGVVPGDKIVELDGRPIRNFAELRSVVSRMEEGRKTTVKVQRRGRYVALPITIGSFDKLQPPAKKK